MSDSDLQIRPLAGALGAEILGVDLTKSLGASDFQSIRRAFLEHGAVVFRGQDLTPETLMAFGRRFGELDVHPIAIGLEDTPEVIRVFKPAGESAFFGTGWHTDNSFFEEPSAATMLHGVVIPPHGGDTLFASMERAYEALSATMKQMLDGLSAVHCASPAYSPSVTGDSKYSGDAPMSYRESDILDREVEHPIVRTHPETGRRSLYVNQMFTRRIAGLSKGESEALLSFLFDHCATPDFTARFRWDRGSVALWDNRCLQHYALDDYQQFERLMMRVTICGDRPR